MKRNLLGNLQTQVYSDTHTAAVSETFEYFYLTLDQFYVRAHVRTCVKGQRQLRLGD